MIGTGAAHIFAELDQPDTNLTAAAGRLPPARGQARGPQDLPPRAPHELALTTQCMNVFVVPGVAGVALPVPQWHPEVDEDVRLHDHVREIIRLRESIVPLAPSLTLEP